MDGSTCADAAASADVGPNPGEMLQTLRVEGARGQMWPAFDPEIRRYAIRALDPVEDLEVVASARVAARVRVAGLRPDDDDRVVLRDVEPGDEIEIVVNGPKGKGTYTLVYLPNDFPRLRVTVQKPGASTDPIYLSLRTAELFYLVKLDANAVPLFQRKLPRVGADFKRHPHGEMTYAVATKDGESYDLVVLDEDFAELKRIHSKGLEDTDHHDFKLFPDGSYVVMSYEPVEHDLREFGGAKDDVIIDVIFQEVNAAGKVVFEWNSWDHMDYGESQAIKIRSFDYAHINSLDFDDDGNWLLSSRAQSQLLKVDRSTGKVLWRMGGVSGDFKFVNDPFEGLCGQHTAWWLDNGNILLFDNGQYCWPKMRERGEYTRIVEYAIDEKAKTAKLVWSYHRKGAYSTSQGSAQRLPNGNTFIGWGAGTSLLATEVNFSGDVVFELEASSSDGAVISYRAFRFADANGPQPRPGFEPGDAGAHKDAGVPNEDAGENEDIATVYPRLARVCTPSCESQARADCKDFDMDGCLRDCVSLGLYLVYYMDCTAEFEAARMCEASIDYTCPGPDDEGQCDSELADERDCMVGGL